MTLKVIYQQCTALSLFPDVSLSFSLFTEKNVNTLGFFSETHARTVEDRGIYIFIYITYVKNFHLCFSSTLILLFYKILFHFNIQLSRGFPKPCLSIFVKYLKTSTDSKNQCNE